MNNRTLIPQGSVASSRRCLIDPEILCLSLWDTVRYCACHWTDVLYSPKKMSLDRHHSSIFFGQYNTSTTSGDLMYVYGTWYLVLDTCSWCFVFGTLYFLYLRIFYLRIWCRYLVPRIDVRRVCKIWAFGIWRIEHISDTLIDDQNSNTWLSMKIILLTSDKLCWKWWCILILITMVIIMRKMLVFF